MLLSLDWHPTEMSHATAVESACPGCGALLPEVEGPTHRYLGASAACWDLFGRGLAGVYPFRAGRWSQSLVDAYAAQHPGVDGPQARQSVAVHMVALHARIAEGLGVESLYDIRSSAAQWGHRHGFVWMEPTPTWSLTFLDVAGAEDEEVRVTVIDRYVEDVYRGWMEGFESLITEWHRAITAASRRA
jgi:hypothetical protein